MNDETQCDSDELSDRSEVPSRGRKLWTSLRSKAEKAAAAVDGAARKAAEAGGQAARSAVQSAKGTVGEVQRRLGEDYYTILTENPLVAHTMSRSSLLEEQSSLLRTAFNIPWVTTLFWSAASGSTAMLQHPIGHLAGEIFHYVPGHVKHWDDVKPWIQLVSARNDGWTERPATIESR